MRRSPGCAARSRPIGAFHAPISIWRRLWRVSGVSLRRGPRLRQELALNPTFTISRFRGRAPGDDNSAAIAGHERVIDGLREGRSPRTMTAARCLAAILAADEDRRSQGRHKCKAPLYSTVPDHVPGTRFRGLGDKDLGSHGQGRSDLLSLAVCFGDVVLPVDSLRRQTATSLMQSAALESRVASTLSGSVPLLSAAFPPHLFDSRAPRIIGPRSSCRRRP